VHQNPRQEITQRKKTKRVKTTAFKLRGRGVRGLKGPEKNALRVNRWVKNLRRGGKKQPGFTMQGRTLKGFESRISGEGGERA